MIEWKIWKKGTTTEMFETFVIVPLHYKYWLVLCKDDKPVRISDLEELTEFEERYESRR